MAGIHYQASEQRVGIIEPLGADRASDSWHTVTFEPPFPPTMSVVVIPMTQTYIGTESPGLRIQNVSHASFQIRFDEAVVRSDRGDFSSEGRHGDEVVGWVAYGF